MKFKIVFIASFLTIAVGAVVFGKIAWDGRGIDRQQFEKPKIRVLSYSTFVSSFGPGPTLARQFEEETGFEVELVNVGDSGLIVKKLTEDPGLYADVILGIDRLHVDEALEHLKWKPLPSELFQRVKPETRLKGMGESQFLPVTWAPLTFLFQKEAVKNVPQNFSDFLSLSSNLKLSLQDPRLSTPGLQFLFWWNQLEDKPHLNSNNIRLSPSWTESYGLFKRGLSQAVFTYLTSIVFHWEVEKNFSYSIFESSEGHPYQVELVGVSERCRQCDVANQFVEFLLQPQSQHLLMRKNFMLPAVSGVSIDGAFAELPTLPLLSYDQLPEFLNQKQSLQKEFLEYFQ